MRNAEYLIAFILCYQFLISDAVQRYSQVYMCYILIIAVTKLDSVVYDFFKFI